MPYSNHETSDVRKKKYGWINCCQQSGRSALGIIHLVRTQYFPIPLYANVRVRIRGSENIAYALNG